MENELQKLVGKTVSSIGPSHIAFESGDILKIYLKEKWDGGEWYYVVVFELNNKELPSD